jgi:hypothetical protein
MADNDHRKTHLSIKEVYYPRLPEFKERERFFLALYTINIRTLGSETGVMEYDFLKTIIGLNRGKSFKKKPLSKGDKVNINGSVFDVLWPPAVIEDEGTLSVVRQALKDFDDAMKEDEITRKLYDLVKREDIFRDYFGEGEGCEKQKDYKAENMNQGFLRREKFPKKLKMANKSLRSAANHISLAFFEDNRFLFLGDAEGQELEKMIAQLESNNRKGFYILVTPHHGTHWHDSLRKIKAVYAISSNGSKLISKMSPYFKQISTHPLSTFANGDVIVPLFLNWYP